VKISLVDYGVSNLPSVERAFEKLGATVERAAGPEQIAGAEALVLPGVGHFSAFVEALRKRGLAAPLAEARERGVPILGICLGMQALFAASEEAPGEAGLKFFAGEVRALPASVKSPHIGWNQMRETRESKLLRGIGIAFAAAIECENVMGVQFHPEKSGEAGARVLRNFLEAAR